MQKGNPGSPRLKTPGKEKYVGYFLAHTNLMQAKAKQRVKVRKRSLQRRNKKDKLGLSWAKLSPN